MAISDYRPCRGDVSGPNVYVEHVLRDTQVNKSTVNSDTTCSSLS